MGLGDTNYNHIRLLRFSNYEYESEIHNSLLRLQSYSGTVDSSSQLKFFHAPNGVVAAICPCRPPWVMILNYL